jgi:Tol biopolymer transport system component
MVSGDTNKFQDVFVVNVQSGEVRRMSTGANGEQGNADSPRTQGEKIAISFDGSWVVFSTSATNLGGDVISKNLIDGEIRIIASEQKQGVSRPAISRNGGYVVFGSGTRLDGRYPSTGIFARFTGITRCRFCTN